MRGWIYVYSNRAMPGLLKIGYTDRDPNIRVAEQHSGLPFPHDIEYESLVENANFFERKVHRALSQYNEAKEWFRVDLFHAVSVIRELAGKEIQYERFRGEEQQKFEKEQRKRIDLAEKREKIKQNIYLEYQNEIDVLASKLKPTFGVPLSVLYFSSLSIFLSVMLLKEEKNIFLPLMFIVFGVWLFKSSLKNHTKDELEKSPVYRDIIKRREAEIYEEFKKLDESNSI